jgi:hypothetical protein
MWKFYWKNQEAGNKVSLEALIEMETRKFIFLVQQTEGSKCKPETRKCCLHGSCLPSYCLPAGPTMHLRVQSRYSVLRHASVAATTIIREDNTTDQITPLLEVVCPVMHTSLYCAYVGGVV